MCNRQPTQYDSLCQETTPDGSCLGSRVYGDCDHMMREVMSVLLTEDQLAEWEEGREARLNDYAKQRSEVEV